MKLFVASALIVTGCVNPGVRQAARVRVETGVEFKPGQKGDLYLPNDLSTATRSAVVVVHGGGWSRRSGDMSQLCRTLARRGFVVFNATYRLAPSHHFPEPVEDVRDAVGWMRTNAAKYNVDQIAIWGYSAGANLVLLAGLDPKLGVAAIVAGGTPADLTVWPDSTMVQNYVGGSYADKSEAWRSASPVNRVDPASPPVFLYHGAWDHIVEPAQMQKMAHALRAQKREVETFEVPYLGHLAVYFFSREAVERGAAFLDRHLK